MGVGGEEKSPGGSDNARRKMVGQASDEVLRQDLGLALQLRDQLQVQAETLTVGQGRLRLLRLASHHLAVTARSSHQAAETGQPRGHH